MSTNAVYVQQKLERDAFFQDLGFGRGARSWRETIKKAACRRSHDQIDLFAGSCISVAYPFVNRVIRFQDAHNRQGEIALQSSIAMPE